MSTSVKFFSSEFSGSPVLSGLSGSLIALLDACLVNGFGLKAVDSLTVADNVATATVSTGHTFYPGGVVLISGASPDGLNGEKRVLSTTANSFTFATSGIANQTATGTISAKMAPAGWSKEFSSGNVAVYRTQGNGFRLRVDDANTSYALVRGFWSMVDVDTGVNPFPTFSQMGSGVWWKRSYTNDGIARNWRLIADDRFIHLFVRWHPTSNYRGSGWYMFGDCVSYLPGDQRATILMGCYGNPADVINDNHFLRMRVDQLGKYLAGDSSQMIHSVGASFAWVAHHADGVAYYYGPTYPGVIDNSLHIHGPVMLLERTGVMSGADIGANLRGHLPGTYQFLHNNNVNFHFSTVDGISGLDGRSVLLANVAAPGTSDHGKPVVIDITGPWR